VLSRGETWWAQMRRLIRAECQCHCGRGLKIPQARWGARCIMFTFRTGSFRKLEGDLRFGTSLPMRWYGVATISRLLKMIGLFCKRALWKRLYSAKETYNLMEPTNRSHPILRCHKKSWVTVIWHVGSYNHNNDYTLYWKVSNNDWFLVNEGGGPIPARWGQYRIV